MIYQKQEKIGATSKRILKYCYDKKNNEISLNQIIQIMEQYSDVKRILDIIQIFLGLGILIQISKRTFIFSGIQGMQQLFLNYSKNDQKIENFHYIDEIQIKDKTYQMKQFKILQQITSHILFQILNSNEKQITRNDFDQIFASYYQKDFNKAIPNDFLNVIQQLGFIVKNEEAGILKWMDDKKNQKCDLYSLDEKYFQKILNQDDGQIRKQIKLEDDLKKEIQDDYITIPKEYMPKQQLSSNFQTAGFALLKGKSIRYIINKLQIIIGKQPEIETQFKWAVDLNIPISKNISKQHAVILYNFYENRFEIKCLSKKFPIILNKKIISCNDKPGELKNKSVINIGNEQLVFYLPRNDNELKD